MSELGQVKGFKGKGREGTQSSGLKKTKPIYKYMYTHKHACIHRIYILVKTVYIYIYLILYPHYIPPSFYIAYICVYKKYVYIYI